MAKKGTEHEKILRVHEIYRLLVKGASRYRILRHATEKWQVSERTGETYLAEARQLLTRDLEIERPKWLEQSIAEMQDWKWQELNPDDRDENVTTANRLAALQFLKAQASLLQFDMS
jgi:hypothetical protein